MFDSNLLSFATIFLFSVSTLASSVSIDLISRAPLVLPSTFSTIPSTNLPSAPSLAILSCASLNFLPELIVLLYSLKKLKTSKPVLNSIFSGCFLLDLKTLPKNLDATDGLAAAVCHFYNSGKAIGGKNYSGWASFVKQNPKKVK